MLNPLVIRIFRDPEGDFTEDLMKNPTWGYKNSTIEKYGEFDYSIREYDDIDYFFFLRFHIEKGYTLKIEEIRDGSKGVGISSNPFSKFDARSRIEAIQDDWDF